jgi:hypothetical protein
MEGNCKEIQLRVLVAWLKYELDTFHVQVSTT